MSQIKIVFVCTGNTCRSPMAAAMAAQIFEEAGLAAVVLSAGVSAWPNQPASRHAIMVMEEGGLCLLAHKASIVSDNILDDASVVLAMTGSHQAILLSDYPMAKEKIFTLAGYVGESIDVSDPFGGSLEDYRACAAQIKGLLVLAVERLKNAASHPGDIN